LINKEVNAKNEAYKKNGIRFVKIKSYDFEDYEIDNFLCEQEVENYGKHVITTTGSPFIGETHLHSYYTANHKITRSVDSNPNIVIQNNYTYQNNDLVKISVKSYSPDAKQESVTEQHIWQYDSSGLPAKMYLVKNERDTTTILIKSDKATKTVTEEVWYVKGTEIDRYYYYYDDKNRLSDVVHFHKYKKKLLPEYIFEYDENGQMKRKTQYYPNTNQVMYWFYKYNDRGLVSEEYAYQKGNLFTGKLKYEYKYD
jgi:hypothetical protein